MDLRLISNVFEIAGNVSAVPCSVQTAENLAGVFEKLPKLPLPCSFSKCGSFLLSRTKTDQMLLTEFKLSLLASLRPPVVRRMLLQTL